MRAVAYTERSIVVHHVRHDKEPIGRRLTEPYGGPQAPNPTELVGSAGRAGWLATWPMADGSWLGDPLREAHRGMRGEVGGLPVGGCLFRHQSAEQCGGLGEPDPGLPRVHAGGQQR